MPTKLYSKWLSNCTKLRSLAVIIEPGFENRPDLVNDMKKFDQDSRQLLKDFESIIKELRARIQKME